jgi:Arc/MetJ-type ribon-helix-helix transcriptional regulator
LHSVLPIAIPLTKLQLVSRVDDELAIAPDALVESGTILSRSDAVRRGLEQFIERCPR